MTLPAQPASGEGLSGIAGIATDVIEALGEIGVGVLTLIETVFPPIPSELILPLAGFQANVGSLDVVLVMIAATVGSYLGAVLLYGLGHVLGEQRAISLLSRLPLVDREDFEKAAGWFSRHGRPAIFFGRLIPGVRSLISLPAGAQRMPLITFSVFTVLGSLVWNGLLVGLGYLLGSQYEVVDRYSPILDWVVIAALAAVLLWLIVRRVRRGRSPASA